MLNFTKKNLQGSQRVCFRLQAIREAKGLTLEYVAEQTKINKTYLSALEECRFEDIPFSSLYQKNFIKKYARAIGENPESFISQFCIEAGCSAFSSKPQTLVFLHSLAKRGSNSHD